MRKFLSHLTAFFLFSICSQAQTDPLYAQYLNNPLLINPAYSGLNTVGLLAQMKIGDMYRFGYAFELPFNNSVGTRFTSHELMFGLNMAILRFHDATAVNNF